MKFRFPIGLLCQTLLFNTILIFCFESPTTNAQQHQRIHSDSDANRIRKAITPNQTGATYVDPDDGKQYADLEFRLTPGDGFGLLLGVHSTGKDVSPTDWTQRNGRNEHTAFELGYLTKIKGAAYAVLKDNTGNIIQQKDFGSIRSSHWPNRKLESDGSINFMSFTESRLVDSVRIEFTGLQKGRYTAVMVVRNEQRFQVTVVIDDLGERIESVEMIGHSGTPLDLRFFVSQGPQTIEEVAPSDDWSDRDNEGKWFIYNQLTNQRKTAAVQWLATQKDFEFIEQIAIYDPDGVRIHGALKSLHDSTAPQWIRVAVLCQQRSSGHSVPMGKSFLTAKSTIGQVLAWDTKYPDQNLDAVVAFERESGAVDGEIGDAMPPLKIDDLWKSLYESEPYHEFSGQSAKPNQIYQQQVLRAIDAITVNRIWEQDVIDQLVNRIKSNNTLVQSRAGLAFSHLESSNLFPMKILNDKVVDSKVPLKVREACLMGMSYGDRSTVIGNTLLPIVIDPSSPLWTAAVSRMGDFDFECVENLVDPSEISEQQKEFLNHERDAFSDKKRRPRILSNSSTWPEVYLLLEKNGFMEVDKLMDYVSSLPEPPIPNDWTENDVLKSQKNGLRRRIESIQQIADSPGGSHLSKETWAAIVELHQQRLKTLD